VPPPILTGFQHRVVVGIAELAVSNNPSAVLTTYSLGSCIGVAIYDPVVRVGGLLHAMLPDSNLDAAKAQAQPGMFVDSGMATLLRAACQMRADKRRLRIFLAGGARIMDDQNLFNIGGRNLTAFEECLRRENLRANAEQVGGQVNRTIGLSIETGRVTLKVSGQLQEVALC
jgi:chemotaxis protein CheD